MPIRWRSRVAALTLLAGLALLPACHMTRAWGRLGSAMVPGSGQAESSAVSRYEEAKRLYERGRYTEAITGFHNWLRDYAKNPLEPAALYHLAHAQQAAGLVDPAKSTYERVAADYPNTPWAAYAREDAAAVGVQGPAVAAYPPRRHWWNPRDWFAADPPAVRAYKAARRDYERGRYEKAIAGFRSVADRFPGNPLVPAADYFVARSYEKLGQADKALEAYSHIVTAYPNSDWEKLAQEDLRRLKAK